MRIGLTATITVMETRAEQVRRGAVSTDMKTVGKLLEGMADNTRPLVLEIYGVREDKLPGDFFMRECRGIFIFEGCKYKVLEKERQREEKRVAALAARQAKLDEIKNGLRAKLKADDRDFDRRHDQQTQEQAETVEARIEEEALTILKKEEGANK